MCPSDETSRHGRKRMLDDVNRREKRATKCKIGSQKT